MTVDEIKELTQEQILAMEAGPELDALVAERVFGSKPYLGSPMLAGADRRLWCVSPITGHRRELDRFSIDIAAAWEVFLALPGGACTIAYTAESSFICIARPRGEPDDQGEEYTVDSGFTATAPLTICRAALLAVIDQ